MVSGEIIRHYSFVMETRISLIIATLVTFSFFQLPAQTIQQIVKGKVTDRHSHSPLSGATVKISHAENEFGTTTDEQGLFFLKDIPVGRYKIQVSYTGYLLAEDELLVIAGRQSYIGIRLVESVQELEEVEVTSGIAADQVPGLRSLGIEKTLRVPANFFDPVRVATAYPGVIATSDQNNSIIVRGNSPNGLLWRLNGLDIVNPNHLTNAGTFSDKPVANGGGVNMLSAQMLDKTDFYMGAFPANYGNALSGVIGMRLRDGNSEEMQYTGQASLIGIDMAAEGPLSKKRNSAFVANYRYSTVGLLSAIGVNFGDEAISFQDFSFNMNFDGKNGRVFSIFGVGGVSRNEFEAKDQAEREEGKDWFDITYDSKAYAVGATYELPLSNSAGFSAGMAFSSSEQERDEALINGATPILVDDYFLERSMFSAFARFSKKIGETTHIDLGVNASVLDDSLFNRHTPLIYFFEPFPCPGFCEDQILSGKSSGTLLQPYLNLSMKLSPKFNVDAGIRYVRYSFNHAATAEPRILFGYNHSSKLKFSMAYGLVSQIQQPQTYFGENNEDLEFTKAHHFNLSNEIQLADGLRLTTEFFYQKLFDVPIEPVASSTFSVLNQLEGFTPGNLLNRGTGQNYGIDVMAERLFYNQNYFWVGGSYYESTYVPGDGHTYDTRFNGSYTFTAVYGKEWTKAAKNRTIGINTRLLYLGGLRETPIDAVVSAQAYETVYNNNDPFSNKLDDYFRIDFRISFRKNKPSYTRTLAIDIQNLLSRENEAYHYYDFHQQKVVAKYQLGIIPVLVYRIDF